jgi:putative solute:sodium symporter small subunit
MQAPSVQEQEGSLAGAQGSSRTGRRGLGTEMTGPGSDQARAYWVRTRALALLMVTLWFVAAFLIHFAAPLLNHLRFLGFPLGFYIAAQGSLIAFVAILVVYVARQDRIDRDCGVDER